MVLPWSFKLVSSSCCRPKFVPFRTIVSVGIEWLCPGWPLLQGVTDLDSAWRWPLSPSEHLPVVYPFCAPEFLAHEGSPCEFLDCQNGCCSVMPSKLVLRMSIIDFSHTVPIVGCICLREEREKIEDRHLRRFYGYIGGFNPLSSYALAATSKQ